VVKFTVVKGLVVGAKVKGLGHVDLKNLIGLTGTIIKIVDKSEVDFHSGDKALNVFVSWEHWSGGWSGNGLVSDMSGYWCNEEVLEVI